MWVLNSCEYLLSGLGNVVVLVPTVLLVWAWTTWYRGLSPKASERSRILPWALAFETIAVVGYVYQIVWWLLIYPRIMEPSLSYCFSSPGSDLLIFFTTIASLVFSAAGQGPGKAAAVLTAVSLVAIRMSSWW